MSSTPPSYLIMIGGCFTIVTSVVILFSQALNSYYYRFFPIFSSLNQITSFALTLLPSLGILYLGQLFLRRPQNQLPLGLAIAVLSIISLIAIVASSVSIFVGIVFSGPPISFTGGIIGAFLNRAGASSPPQANPPA